MLMIIGDVEIRRCNDCPAYEWGGESISHGDYGHMCSFGAFNGSSGEKKVPKNCPIVMANDFDKVKTFATKEKCSSCVNYQEKWDDEHDCFVYDELRYECDLFMK